MQYNTLFIFQISRAWELSWPPLLLLDCFRASGLPLEDNMIECGRTSFCSRWRLPLPPPPPPPRYILTYYFPLWSFYTKRSFQILLTIMAAIRVMHIAHGLPTDPFRGQRIPLYLKALKIYVPFLPSLCPSLDIPTLYALLQFCDTAPHPIIFKALYSVCFFHSLGHQICCHIH